MTAIRSAIDYTADLAGRPNEAGQVYFGVAGQDPETNPITVYWDAALTQIATQPLTMTAGYIVHSGARAQVYTAATSWSVRTKDRSGAQIDYFPTVTAPASAGILASTAGASLVGYILDDTVGADQTIEGKLQQSINLDDFAGATDHAKLTAAVAFCKATGAALNLPSRRIDINSDLGTITLEEVSLQGNHVLDGATGTVDKGTMLWITGTTNSPFKVRRGVVVDGVGIYYPNQTDSASPTAYPVTFNFDFTNGAVQFVRFSNNVVYNAYKVMDIDNGGTGAVGHVEITGNYFNGLNRGIYVRYNSEHIRIQHNNFSFGFWLAATEAGSRAYVRANCTHIEVAQSDGIEINDNLIFGALNGVLVAGTGLCQFMHITQNKFDQTRFGVKASGSGRFDGSIIANTFNCYNPQDTTLQGRSVDIQTTGSGTESVTILGNNFDATTEDHIYVSGNTPLRYIVVGSNNYRLWAAFKASGSYGAVNAGGTNTNVVVTGGWFEGGSSAYANGILGSPNTLTLTGATFDQCQAPISVTANTATVTGCASFSTGASASDSITATALVSVGNKFDKPTAKSPIRLSLSLMPNYADDTAAAAGSVPVGGFYRNGSIMMVRAA